MLRVPYMAGETDFEQLNTIFSALGTPTEAEWPVRLIPLLSLFSPHLLTLFFTLGSQEAQRFRRVRQEAQARPTIALHCCIIGSDRSTEQAAHIRPKKANHCSRCMLPSIRALPRIVAYSLFPSLSQSLSHPFFHAAPRPTAPAKLPKPTGELVPRALAPEEGTRGSKKRKSGALLEGLENELDSGGGGGGKKVARMLDFS